MSGFDRRLIATSAPTLSSRMDGFGSDRAAFAAVLRNPRLAIVPDWFLQTGGGPPANVLAPGDRLLVRDAVTGVRRALTVAGVVSADYPVNGVMVAARTARAVMGRDATPSRLYATTRPGLSPSGAAASLDARLVRYGVDAEAVRAVVDRGLATGRRFFTLSEGYIALGLLIGIAGLGVVMVRAVRERRNEIGMLRAMGFRRSTVRSAFLLEAGFVAARGVLIGAGLALLVTWELLTFSDAMGPERIPFSAPWGELLGILAATIVASLAAALMPANRAMRIPPAEALRTTV
jgi:putative ABC transport system permease protein